MQGLADSIVHACAVVFAVVYLIVWELTSA